MRVNYNMNCVNYNTNCVNINLAPQYSTSYRYGNDSMMPGPVYDVTQSNCSQFNGSQWNHGPMDTVVQRNYSACTAQQQYQSFYGSGTGPQGCVTTPDYMPQPPSSGMPSQFFKPSATVQNCMSNLSSSGMSSDIYKKYPPKKNYMLNFPTPKTLSQFQNTSPTMASISDLPSQFNKTSPTMASISDMPSQFNKTCALPSQFNKTCALPSQFSKTSETISPAHKDELKRALYGLLRQDCQKDSIPANLITTNWNWLQLEGGDTANHNKHTSAVQSRHTKLQETLLKVRINPAISAYGLAVETDHGQAVGMLEMRRYYALQVCSSYEAKAATNNAFDKERVILADKTEEKLQKLIEKAENMRQEAISRNERILQHTTSETTASTCLPTPTVAESIARSSPPLDKPQLVSPALEAPQIAMTQDNSERPFPVSGLAQIAMPLMDENSAGPPHISTPPTHDEVIVSVNAAVRENSEIDTSYKSIVGDQQDMNNDFLKQCLTDNGLEFDSPNLKKLNISPIKPRGRKRKIEMTAFEPTTIETNTIETTATESSTIESSALDTTIRIDGAERSQRTESDKISLYGEDNSLVTVTVAELAEDPYISNALEQMSGIASTNSSQQYDGANNVIMTSTNSSQQHDSTKNANNSISIPTEEPRQNNVDTTTQKSSKKKEKSRAHKSDKPSSDKPSSGRRKPKGISSTDKSVLLEWYETHVNYPYIVSQSAENYLRANTKLKRRQIRKWMANQRNRNGNTLNISGNNHPMSLKASIERAEQGDQSDEEKENNASPKPSEKRKCLTKQSKEVLLQWWNAHQDDPYPDEEEKKALAEAGDIKLTQVKSWFANMRTRTKKTKRQIPNSFLEKHPEMAPQVEWIMVQKEQKRAAKKRKKTAKQPTSIQLLDPTCPQQSGVLLPTTVDVQQPGVLQPTTVDVTSLQQMDVLLPGTLDAQQVYLPQQNFVQLQYLIQQQNLVQQQQNIVQQQNQQQHNQQQHNLIQQQNILQQHILDLPNLNLQQTIMDHTV